jgi:hypothetical protein
MYHENAYEYTSANGEKIKKIGFFFLLQLQTCMFAVENKLVWFKRMQKLLRKVKGRSKTGNKKKQNYEVKILKTITWWKKFAETATRRW